MLDLALDDSGDLLIQFDDIVLVDEAKSLAQRIAVSLSVLLGEWALDTSAGVDWLGTVLGRSDLVEVEAVFRARIIEVPGVERIDEFSLSLSDIRRLSVRFRVTAARGISVAASFELDGDGDVLAVLAED